MTTYLFIDGGYLRTNYSNSVRPWFGSDGEIGFAQIKDGFLGGGIARCFYYDALEDEKRDNESDADFNARIARDEQIFTKIEELNGYFVRLGSLTGQRKRRQKKVDILLAVEALDHAVRRNMDSAILLTGDRDFEPLVDSLVRIGIQVHVVGDKKHTSAHLRRAADASTLLTFDDYYEFTVTSLKNKFPLRVHAVDGIVTDEMDVCASGTFQGKNIYLLRNRVEILGEFDYEYYLKVFRFYGETESLMLKGGELERLKLYFELQYGEVLWKN